MRLRAPWTLLFAAALAGCNSGAPSGAAGTSTTGTGATGSTTGTAGDGPGKASAGLQKLGIEDTVVGKGDPADDGDTLYMDYTGTLANGKQFDSSKDRNEPFSFVLGNGQVIKGWDEGLKGMRVGGKRKLSIPYRLAYGERAMGEDIPARSDLYFDVELLGLVKKGREDEVQRSVTKPGTGPAIKNGDTVTIHYTGTLLNGVKFDSSKDRKQPFTFKVGAGNVVPGFDAALSGMKKGAAFTALLPPSTAYGSQAQGPIPANSMLRFEIEVLDVKRK